MKRCAIVLGEGKFANEREGYRSQPGPRLEFVRIADVTDADVHSFASACAARGKLFHRLFASRPWLGGIAQFVSVAKYYDSCYVTGEDVGLPLALALKLRGWKGKMFCVVHNMTPKKIQFLRTIGHGVFGQLITVSKRQRDVLIERCAVPESKALAVFNWVDDQFFRPGTSQTTATAPVFMSCGLENRDYGTVVRAAGKVNANFKIYGHGFFGSSKEQFNGPPNVEWMPRVSFDELRDAYAACDAVIVPINDVDYAAGVTGLVEAMSTGKPVIASGSGGIEEYLQSADPGFVVPPGDADAMARAATQLVEHLEQGRAKGLANREWVLQNCALDKYAELVKEIMEA